MHAACLYGIITDSSMAKSLRGQYSINPSTDYLSVFNFALVCTLLLVISHSQELNPHRTMVPSPFYITSLPAVFLFLLFLNHSQLYRSYCSPHHYCLLAFQIPRWSSLSGWPSLSAATSPPALIWIYINDIWAWFWRHKMCERRILWR